MVSTVAQRQTQSITGQDASGGIPGLRMGDSGPAVQLLQELLGALGFPVDAGGAFGATTQNSVREFQRQIEAAMTGIADPATMAELQARQPEAPVGQTGVARDGFERTQRAPANLPAAPTAQTAGGAPTVRAGALALSNPPGGRTTGLTATDANDRTQYTAATPPQMHVKVPFYSQFEGGHGYTPSDTACAKAAKAMANAAGARPGSASGGIQIATGEDSKGRITIDRAAARRGNDYIDSQLASGKPVVVGVSHADKAYNHDKVTDHFVTITGKGVDEQGRAYYTFNDPATTNKSKGADTNPNNRFYPDENGKLVRDGALAKGYVADRRFEVSVVVRNQ